MCQFSTTTWSEFDCSIDRQNSCEIVPKIRSYRCHAGIYSLIWTFCQKLMLFYWNAILFYIIFVVMHDEVFGYLAIGTLIVNKMAVSIEVSAEMVSYSYFYWKKYDCNWVTKLRSRYYCNMSRIRSRLIRCHWSFDPWWVKISGHMEQVGPCGSTLHFVNNRYSRVKTQGASCIGGFGQTDGQRKFELGIPKTRGSSCISGASHIRDKMVIKLFFHGLCLK